MSNSTHETDPGKRVLENLEMYGQWLRNGAILSAPNAAAQNDLRVELIDPEAAPEAQAEDMQLTSLSTRLGRRSLLMAAASLIAVALAAWTLTSLLTDSTEEPAALAKYVLPGETVLSTDPLIVTPAPAPTPKFDTSELGRQLKFEPAIALTPEFRTLLRHWIETPSDQSNELVKATILGHFDGEPWAVVVADDPSGGPPRLGEEAAGNFRIQTIFTNDTGTGTGDFADPDGLQFITPTVETGSVDTMSSGESEWALWYSLTPDVAAVSFDDSEQRLWIQPHGGVAIFPFQSKPGASITMDAYDVGGVLLRSQTQTVR